MPTLTRDHLNKFTPGPWSVDCGDLEMDGQIVSRPLGSDRASPAERAANMLLIAAAPDLYAALEGIRSMCVPGMNWSDEVGQMLLVKARAALAKARGE
jgi:hypothetical protein